MVNLARLRLVTFDVTGTLLQFRTSPGKQYGEVGAMYGILCDDNNALSANFKVHWRRMNAEHPNFGLKTGLGWENWWKTIIRCTFRDAKFTLDDRKLDAISNHLIDVYKTSTCWQPCHGAFGLLSYLRSSKCRTLGVVSNFDPRLEEILENNKLRHYFKFVINSYSAGFAKPDANIFAEAMRESGLKDLHPEECLHIGDMPALDYAGAKNSDWHGILIHDKDPKKITEKYPAVDVNHVFTNLYDLHKHFLEEEKQNLVACDSRC